MLKGKAAGSFAVRSSASAPPVSSTVACSLSYAHVHSNSVCNTLGLSRSSRRLVAHLSRRLAGAQVTGRVSGPAPDDFHPGAEKRGKAAPRSVLRAGAPFRPEPRLPSAATMASYWRSATFFGHEGRLGLSIVVPLEAARMYPAPPGGGVAGIRCFPGAVDCRMLAALT